MDSQPTVTVSVTAYNSSRYIRETLESIKAQTYKNIILQISDDCSTDNTVAICERWIEENKDCFVKTKIITSEKNTGVSANCNRAWDACETDWYKGIAGDDILLPNCIETFIDYVLKNKDTILVFGKAKAFSTKNGLRVYAGYPHNYDFFSLSHQEQHDYLIFKGNDLPAAAAFYNISTLKKMDFRHDIRLRNLEDYPKWIRLNKMGIKFHYLNIDTVLYRVEQSSLSVGIFSPIYYKQEVMFNLYYMLDEIKTEEDKDKIYAAIAEHLGKFYTYAYNKATIPKEVKTGISILKPIRTFRKLVFYFLQKTHIYE